MLNSAKLVFQRTLQFRGRADRYEFWSFMWFCIVVSVALLIINSLIFGPTISTTYTIRINATGEQSESTQLLKSYSAGWLGTVFSIICFMPSLAAAWRRLQDTGKPGFLIFLPLVGIGIATSLLFLTSQTVQIDSSNLPTGVKMPDTMRIPSSVSTAVTAILVGIGSFIATIVLLARRSELGPNKYGPNPNEVPL